MFSLRKRIEKLEKKQEQVDCGHHFLILCVERHAGAYMEVKSTCENCGKMINRQEINAEISKAERTLRAFLLSEKK